MGSGSHLAPLAYTLAALVIILDQISKAWVLHGLRLPAFQSIDVLPPVLRFTMVWNQGVSYGLLNSFGEFGRWLLVLFSGVVAIAIAVWARRVERRLPALALGLVLGGAVGNMIDRARLGAVVDFIHVTGLHFPWVFNIADSAISVGVVLLLLDSLIAPKPAAATPLR